MKKQAFGLLVVLICSSAYAQTGPALMIFPWKEGTNVEFYQDVLYIDSVDTEAGQSDSLSIFETTARIRLDNQVEHGLVFGFDQVYLKGDIYGPGIDDDVLIQNIAVGIPLMEWDGWKIGMTAGIGYAGNDAWDESDSWFGKGSVIASKELDADTILKIYMEFDGNRTLWPDLPIIGFTYSKRLNDELWYGIGVPYNYLRWKPCDKATVEVTYLLPFSIRAYAGYELLDNVELFTLLESRRYAFHMEHQRDTQRTFLEQYRAELGAKWAPCDEFKLTLAGGYAFEQELSRGYDVRDLKDEVELSDEAYVRVAVEISF